MLKTIFITILSIFIFMPKSFAENNQENTISSLNNPEDFKNWKYNIKSFEKNTDKDYTDLYPATMTFDKVTDENGFYGVSLKPSDKNWKNYKYLEFNIFNPEADNIYLGVRIDDEDKQNFVDLYQLAYKENNKIVIPLKDLPVNLEKIRAFTIFLKSSVIFKSINNIDIPLYLGNIKLSNEKLQINSIDTFPTKDFNNRIKISAQANFVTNWQLNIFDENNQMLADFKSHDVENPSWIYTFQKSGKYSIKLKANNGLEEDTKTKTININSIDKNKVWVGKKYASERVDYYDTKLDFAQSDNLFLAFLEKDIDLDLINNDTQAIQIPFITNFDADLKITLKNNKFNASIYREGYLNISPVNIMYKINKSGFVSDVLYPVQDNFKVKSGNLETLFIEFKSGEIKNKSIYNQEIELDFGKIKKIINIKINEHPVKINDPKTLKTSFSVYEDQINKIYKDKKYIEYVYQMLNEHGITSDSLYRPLPISIEEVNSISLLTDKNNTNICYFDEKSLADIDQKIELIKPVVDYLKKNNLTDRYYFYMFDESFEDSFSAMKVISDKLKKEFPEIKIMTTSRIFKNEDLKKQLNNIDYWVPSLRDFYTEKLGSEYKWWYLFIAVRPPYLNWFLESRLIESRMLGIQSFQYGIEGCLYYTVNRWVNNSESINFSDMPFPVWEPRSFEDANGDGALIYPGEDKILPSLRLKNFKYGLDDYSLLEYASRKISQEKLKSILEKVSKNLKTYTKSSELLYNFRKELINNLE